MSVAPCYWDRFLKHTLDRVVILDDSDPDRIKVAVNHRAINKHWELQPAEWKPMVIPPDEILTYDEAFDYLNERQATIERSYFQDMAFLSSSRDRIDELFAR